MEPVSSRSSDELLLCIWGQGRMKRTDLSAKWMRESRKRTADYDHQRTDEENQGYALRRQSRSIHYGFRLGVKPMIEACILLAKETA